jgi:hypothetical protein
MTDEQARTAANIVLIAGAAAAVYYVLRTPPLRRLAWDLGRAWVKGPLLVWGANELRRAWDASAPARG